MRLAVFVLAIASGMPAFGQQPAAQPAATYPAQTGTYLQGPSGFIRLEQSFESGTKVHGRFKSLAGSGIRGVDTIFIYGGARAALQLHQHKPVFLLVTSAETPIESISIVRFNRKKNRREISSAHANARSGSASVGSKGVIPLTVTHPPGGGLLITPQQNLPSGEYLLMDAPARDGGAAGYAFGIK